MADGHDAIGFWLEQASRYPLLPREEMLRIAKIIQDPKTSPTKRERLVNKMVLHNLKLIPRIAKKFTGTKRTYNFGDCNSVDLMQAGVFGLKRAVEKFDPERGYQFSTYAVPWIRQAIQRYAYANFSPVRVPESTLRDLFKANQYYSSTGERYRTCDFNRGQWDRIGDAYRALNMNSLDQKMDNKNNDDCNDLHEAIACKPQDQPKTKFSFDEIIKGVDLDESEIFILKSYYMENNSVSNIAKELGRTLEAVRSRLPRIVAKIRHKKVLTGNFLH